MVDFSDKYNTQLNAQQELDYKNWLSNQSRATGRDLNLDHYDYDMRGWWNENKGIDIGKGHLTDKFKKPNHPTFSNQSQYHGVDEHQGGEWLQMPDKTWSFTPGATNLKMYNNDQLQDYFNRVEKGNKLQLSPMDGARLAPDGMWYIDQGGGQYARVEI